VADDAELLARLRARDEGAFAQVVRAWSPSMQRVARAHVSTDASAGEVVQEAWLAVVRGLDAFEGRSSLKTWVFRILVNLATTRGVKEKRTRPFSSLLPEDGGAAVEDARFEGGAWTQAGAPQEWRSDPEQASLGAETRAVLGKAVDSLPERHRAVLVLRDVEGLSSAEVCDLLGLSPENQRVLLHRARARVRESLSDYLAGPVTA